MAVKYGAFCVYSVYLNIQFYTIDERYWIAFLYRTEIEWYEIVGRLFGTICLQKLFECIKSCVKAYFYILL